MKRSLMMVAAVAWLGLAAGGCGDQKGNESGSGTTTPPGTGGQPSGGPAAASFKLTSTAFAEGQPIPSKHSGIEGEQSPPLAWADPPPGTKSFALICDDPDAPGMTFVHWVLYNIPATARSLPEGLSSDGRLPDGTRNGTTDNGVLGYFGPAPPAGPAHRYFFKLYAVDTTLDLAPGAEKPKLLSAMQGHILAETKLMGTYQSQ